MHPSISLRQCWLQRIERQMLEPGHAQVRDGNEVSGGSESPGSSLGLLQQAVHGLHIGVAATVQHPAHDRRLALHLGVGNEALLTRIHNGVLDVPPEMRADHSGNGPVKIISVARLDAPKDHALLIDALATIKDIPWELELIGDGPLTESIRARAHSLGIGERILFAGLCNDVPVRLSNADLFVLASGFEGFPLSILEAMRANLPVIASDVGGVSESVVEGTTGFLVPKGDKDALADRLRLLITDPELRKRLGLQGRFFYEREFSFDIMYNRTFEIYQRVLERRGRA